MALTNWPPASAPPWPPPGYSIFETSSIDDALRIVEEIGWTWRNPTTAENNEFFNSVRCQLGHRVDGVMVTDTRPGGLVYPFARCRGPDSEGMALWWPYSLGYIG